jgi:predicted ATPase
VRDQARRFITLVDELYNQQARLVVLAECAPEDLFFGSASDEPILDLEALQSEGAVPDAKLRRDLGATGGAGGVMASTTQEVQRLTAHLGGAEEQFAFARAVSRLLEMQTRRYWARRGSVS